MNSKSEIASKGGGRCGGDLWAERRRVLICVLEKTQAAPGGWTEWKEPGSRLLGEERCRPLGAESGSKRSVVTANMTNCSYQKY